MAPVLLIFIIEFLSSSEAMNCPCLSKAKVDVAIFAGAAGGACLLAVMIMLVVVCLLKRRKNKEYNKSSARRQGYSGYENCHPGKPSNVGEDAGPKGTQISDDMIILENPMYASADSVPKKEESRNQSDKPYNQSTVHDGENPREAFSRDQHLNPNNIYAVVNKKPKATDKPSKPTTPTKPSKAIKPNIYAVVNKKPKATDKSSKSTPPTNTSKPIKPYIYAVVNKTPKSTDKPSKPIKPPKPYPQPKPAMAVKPPVPKKPINKL